MNAVGRWSLSLLAAAGIALVAVPSGGDPANGSGSGTTAATATVTATATVGGGKALPPAVPGNLELAADLLEVDTKGQTATLTGNVVLGKGDLSLKCPKIEVRYDSGGPRVSWAKGSGGVIADVKGVKGEAPEFELDLVKQKLVLRGGVRLYRGQGWVVADGAEIDLATARLTMTNVKASLPVGGALKKP
jgi:lipopolysaccharide transport protein LptA